MADNTVYFIKAEDNEDDRILCGKLSELIRSKDLFNFIDSRDITAIKTHFGESAELGYVRPLYFKMIGDLVREKGGMPFLTETSTLYKGNRSNAIIHLSHASKQGFDHSSTGLPIIMADGLFGDDECDVPVNGRIYKSVKIAALLEKCNSLVMVSHFTGHLAAGFGATLKNLGMGCSSRKGKMAQHSTGKPSINKKACTACGMCVKWCPAEAITINEDFAVIDKSICIGCGECLAMCRFDAVRFGWGATYEELQKKVVEHAMGVHKLFGGKAVYINMLTRISKDCDCMSGYNKVTPDIGILISYDPVACDAAALDLVEKRSGKKFSELSYDIPYRFQIDYSASLKFGSADYNLVEA